MSADPKSPFGHAFDRMPSGESERALLLERLQRVAREAPDEPQQGGREPLVVFRLGERERYAVPYRYAVEVLPPVRPAPVPCTPPSIAGVISRRGELLTVLDLKQFFRTRPEGYGPQAHILVVAAAGMTVGLLMDELIGEQTIEVEQLTPGIPSERVTNVDYVRGIHEGRTTVIDVPSLLGDPGLLVNERVT